MKLSQLKIEYQPVEDRVLVRVATDQASEVVLALTRRCVKLLWPALLGLARGSPQVAAHADPLARDAVLGFQHEQAVRQADFSRPYEPEVRDRPLGEAAILVARIQTGRDAAGLSVLTLQPWEGQGISLTLDATLLHATCRLLQQAVDASDWDLKLALPDAAAAMGEAGAGGAMLN